MDLATGLPAILLVALWMFVVYRGVVMLHDTPGRMSAWVLFALSLPIAVVVVSHSV